MPFRKENRHLTLSLLALIAALFVIAIGVQAHVAQQDNETRDRNDRRYANCLTNFASDLVETIEKRGNASVRLQKAAERKNAALDRILRVVTLAQRTPPEATVKEFRRALEARLRVQARYDAIEKRTEDIRDENPYESPEVTCTR